jgi:tetratricopeptide (TPR) repeat protein
MSKKSLTLFSLLLFFTLYLSVLVVSGLGQRRGEKIEGNPPELKVELKLFKKQYLLREPIWVRVQVTNIDDKEGDFYFMTSDRLTIKDSSGKVYPCNISVNYMGPVTIRPHQTLENEFEVLCSYGLPEHRFAKGWWWYLPPNKYTIYYELSYRLKKAVRSSVYTFEVLEPKGNELKAMDLLVDSFNLLGEKKKKEALEKLDNLIHQFPNSVYAPFAWLRKISVYRIYIEDSNTALNTCNELIEKYPYSREAIAAVEVISAIYQNKRDKKGFINAMNDLIKKYPDTDISREAEKQLDQVKDKEFE